MSIAEEIATMNSHLIIIGCQITIRGIPAPRSIQGNETGPTGTVERGNCGNLQM